MGGLPASIRILCRSQWKKCSSTTSTVGGPASHDELGDFDAGPSMCTAAGMRQSVTTYGSPVNDE